MARFMLLTLACTALLGAVRAHAQTGPGLTVTVTATVTFDASTGLHTYAYQVRNEASSTRPLESFYLEVPSRGLLSNIQSPAGWTFGEFLERSFVVWSATEGVPDVPDTDPRAGAIVPSPFQIQPGQTLSGFSFRSPMPAVSIRFMAEGFATGTPVVDVEDLPEGEELVDFVQRSFQGTTQGPRSATVACNGQGDDADGDGVCDATDNCTFAANANQLDSGGAPTEDDPTGATPDGIGNACQCGGPSGNGRIGPEDVDLLRNALVGLPATIPAPALCSVSNNTNTTFGLPVGCDLVDLLAIQLAVLAPVDDSIPDGRLASRSCPPALP